MKKSLLNALPYLIAGTLLAIQFLLSIFAGRAYCILSLPDVLNVMYYMGWATWAFAVILLFLPYFTGGETRPRKGRAEDSGFSTTGIFSVIRHPENLGWILVYMALILFRPDLPIIFVGAAGMACVYIISRLEDGKFVKKFGKSYRTYMQDVPAMNLAAGIVRRLKH